MGASPTPQPSSSSPRRMLQRGNKPHIIDYQQPTVFSRQKKDVSRGEVHDNHWPPIAGGEHATSLSSFAVKQRESYVHLNPDDYTSINLAANMREPFDQPVAVLFQDTSPSPFTATAREPFGALHPHLTSFKANNAAERTASPGSQTQHQSFGSSLLRRPSPSMSVFSCEQPPQESRYYAQALSAEDKLALVQGENNHGLREWSGEKSVTRHDARKDMVPRMMPKVERTNALGGIEYDKQYSQRALYKLSEKVRKFFGLSRPRIKVTSIDTEKDEEPACTKSRRASRQSTYDLCSSTLSPPELPLLPESKSTPSFQEFVDNAPHYNAQVASSGDYFSQPPNPRISTYNAHRISSLAPTSGPPSSSDTSMRVRSPLSQELQFRANPETTFDSLVAPHRSGKGEVLRDSKYAQKVKISKTSSSSSSNSNAKTRRLTKMPSIPLLLKRGSRSENGSVWPPE